MGLFDKAKEMAASAAGMAADAAIQKADEAKQASIEKKEEKAALKAIENSFHETRRFGYRTRYYPNPPLLRFQGDSA